MDTRIDEIEAGLFRISTFVPHIAPPAGFTFNQFLVMGEEPLLFHLGHRKTFPSTAAAISRVLPLEKLRWLSFGHVEADECGGDERLARRRTERRDRAWNDRRERFDQRHGGSASAHSV